MFMITVFVPISQNDVKFDSSYKIRTLLSNCIPAPVKSKVLYMFLFLFLNRNKILIQTKMQQGYSE